MSKLLQMFYDDYHQWLITGAHQDDAYLYGFKRYFGLCGNLTNWVMTHKIDINQCGELRDEMSIQFIDAGLSERYPFGGSKLYMDENIDRTLHLNPQRIQWVKDHITK